MRLLNAFTLTFHEFEGSNIPSYAILSHRWENDEVTYQDMKTGLDHVKRKAGFFKIEECSDQAVKDDLQYVWIDTCCIDKTSSAELTEAINSMYQWYQNSEVCYAYLSDVLSKYENIEQQVAGSKWWTRGWTLQELIAPPKLVFFGKGAVGWVNIGDKTSLVDFINQITGIDEEVLHGMDVGHCSIAMRMSWAASRVTTRVEDLSYCLLGIFGVNMPLLYGEGKRAFLRLQEEIMKQSDDQTLFAWNLGPDDVQTEKCGPLATSPAQFRGCSGLVPIADSDAPIPYSMTNKGLRIELPVSEYKRQQRCMAILQCSTKTTFPAKIGLPILRANQDERSQYARDGRYTYPLQSAARDDLSHAKKVTIFMRQEPETSVIRRTKFLVHVPESLEIGVNGPIFFDFVRSTSEDFNSCKIWKGFFVPSESPKGAVAFVINGFDVIVLYNTEMHQADRFSCKVLCTDAPEWSPAHHSLRDKVQRAARRLTEQVSGLSDQDPSKQKFGRAPLLRPPKAEDYLSLLQDTYTNGRGAQESFAYTSNGGAIHAYIGPEITYGERALVLNIELYEDWGDSQHLCEVQGNELIRVGEGAKAHVFRKRLEGGIFAGWKK